MRVLIVEDERTLATTVATGLRRRGAAVDLAHDGTSGLEKALLGSYDVVILDRDLPGIHGDDVCAAVVEQCPGTRILMLTASSELDDLVRGLTIGADDYLPKPFRFDELHARLLALTRRAVPATPPVLRVGDIEADPGRQLATRNGTVLALTPREFAVLVVLLRADGLVVSSEELLEKAWDEFADPFTTSVRVIMSRLRAKLGPPDVIVTVVGRGYRIATGDAS